MHSKGGAIGECSHRLTANGDIKDPHPEWCLCVCHEGRGPPPAPAKRGNGQRGQDQKPRKKRRDEQHQGLAGQDLSGPGWAGALGAVSAGGGWEEEPLMGDEEARRVLRAWAEKEGLYSEGEGLDEWGALCCAKLLIGPAYVVVAMELGVKDVETREYGGYEGLVLLRQDQGKGMVHVDWMPAFELAMRVDPLRCTQQEHWHPGQVTCVAWLRKLPPEQAVVRVWAHPVAGRRRRSHAYEVCRVASLTPGLIPVTGFAQKNDVGLTREQYVYAVHRLVGLPVPEHLEDQVRRQAAYRISMARSAGVLSMGPMPWVPGDAQAWAGLNLKAKLGGPEHSWSSSQGPVRRAKSAKPSVKGVLPGPVPQAGDRAEPVKKKSTGQAQRTLTGKVSELEEVVRAISQGDDPSAVTAHDGGGVVLKCRAGRVGAAAGAGGAHMRSQLVALKVGGKGFEPGTAGAIVRESVIMQGILARWRKHREPDRQAAARMAWMPALWTGEMPRLAGGGRWKVEDGLLPLRLARGAHRPPDRTVTGSGRPGRGAGPHSHPRVDGCLQSEEDQRSTVLGIAMEWQEGAHVCFDKMRRRTLLGPWTSKDRAQISISLMDALAEMHQVGFVHRDLKETNYIVRKMGGSLQVVLLDFAGVMVVQDEHEMSVAWRERVDRYVMVGGLGNQAKHRLVPSTTNSTRMMQAGTAASEAGESSGLASR